MGKPLHTKILVDPGPPQDRRWHAIDGVKGVPSGEHPLVLMGTNARTDMLGIGWTDRKVLDEYWCNQLNDSGERLLLHAEDDIPTLLNIFYATPVPGMPQIFQVSSRLDYILTRQDDRRFESKIPARTAPNRHPESDQHLGFGNIRHMGRAAPNRRTTVTRIGGLLIFQGWWRTRQDFPV